MSCAAVREIYEPVFEAVVGKVFEPARCCLVIMLWLPKTIQYQISHATLSESVAGVKRVLVSSTFPTIVTPQEQCLGMLFIGLDWKRTDASVGHRGTTTKREH